MDRTRGQAGDFGMGRWVTDIQDKPFTLNKAFGTDRKLYQMIGTFRRIS